MTRAVLVLAAFLTMAAPAMAVQPDEILSDPALEARAREISQELRCLVCQNQSIDDSDAPLAKDLRVIVRERLLAGDSDVEVIAYVTARYGDFVLLRPPMKPMTYLLWFGPGLVLLIAGGMVYAAFSRRRRTATVPAALSDAERRRVAELLNDEEGAGR